jgi:hypothetical protein
MSTGLVVLTAGPDVFVCCFWCKEAPIRGNSLRSAFWLDSWPGLEPTWIMSVLAPQATEWSSLRLNYTLPLVLHLANIWENCSQSKSPIFDANRYINWPQSYRQPRMPCLHSVAFGLGHVKTGLCRNKCCKICRISGLITLLNFGSKTKSTALMWQAKIESPVTWIKNHLGYVGTVRMNGQSDLTHVERRYNSVRSNEEKMEL